MRALPLYRGAALALGVTIGILSISSGAVGQNLQVTSGPVVPQFFVGLVGGPNWNTTTFSPAGSPAFNVNGFGGSINPYAGMMFPFRTNTELSKWSFGGQLGYIGSNVKGDTFYPTSGGVYATAVKQTITVEGRVEYKPGPDPGPRVKINFSDILAGTKIFVTAGVALTKSEVTGTGPGFAAIDTLNYTSFTYSAGMMFPFVTNQLYAVVQTRGMFGGNKDSHLPGLLPTNIWSQGLDLGLEFRW